jgi:PAS domain S-box-containing protein
MQSGLYVPLRLFNRTLGCISVESDQPGAFTQEDEHLLVTLAVQAAVAIDNARLFQNAQNELAERKRVEEELRRRELEYRSLAENIPDIVARFDPQLRHIYVSDVIEKITGIPAQSFIGKTNRDLQMPEKLAGIWDENISRVFENGQARQIEFDFLSPAGLNRFESRLVPELGPTGKVERVLSIARDITERKKAELRIRQQLERLTALSRIDQAIMSSFDLNVTLDILLSQVISQLQVDAADVLRLHQDGRRLEYAAGQGFRTSTVEATDLRVGESYAGRAAKERQLVKLDHLTYKPLDPLFSRLFAAEGFISYCGVPLIAKGKVVGVLEVFCRTRWQLAPEWLDFLNTLAGQAAIAIENATLFENLQYSNRELSQAYEATIEGWSHAMDLRDKETEGHTQRVTEMTLALARAMQIDEAQMVHIRRGSLLHDMGKLGIPDHILLKAEKLTDEEWLIMRKHPQFAYDMLSSIRYLQPALKIPYCHHEHWDGTGYPRGLAGEEIPLEARIFAVVDVWDALRSDRPYRPAWDHDSARNYIRDYAGTFFDPNVVRHFLKIVK